MKVRTRFIKSVIATAQSIETDLPWTRGATRRAAAIRRAAAPVRRLRSA